MNGSSTKRVFTFYFTLLISLKAKTSCSVQIQSSCSVQIQSTINLTALFLSTKAGSHAFGQCYCSTQPWCLKVCLSLVHRRWRFLINWCPISQITEMAVNRKALCPVEVLAIKPGRQWLQKIWPSILRLLPTQSECTYTFNDIWLGQKVD